MRYLLLFVFATTTSYACPLLHGLHVNCVQSDSSVTKVRIVQTLKDSIPRYKVDWAGQRTQIHDADGVTRETPIFDTGMLLKKTTTCEGEFLRHHAVMVGQGGDVRFDILHEYSMINGKLHFRAIDEHGVFNEVVCR